MAEQVGDSRQGGLDYDDTQFFFPASILSKKNTGEFEKRHPWCCWWQGAWKERRRRLNRQLPYSRPNSKPLHPRMLRQKAYGKAHSREA